MAKEPKEPSLWQGRSIAAESDAHGLDQQAATFEFGHRLPRDKAEEAAHKDYKRDSHAAAAAHHLAGLKGAHAAGDLTEARKHSLLYELHLKALGHDGSGPVPEEVASRTADGKEPKVFKFKPHKADMMVLDEKPAEEVTKSEDMSERFHDLMRVCRFILTAKSF